MLAARILFVSSLLGSIGAVNALARPNHALPWPLRPWWLFAVLTAELVPLRIVLHGALTAALVALGAADYRAGRIGLGLTSFMLAAYAVLQVRAHRAAPAIATALDEAGIATRARSRPRLLRILAAYPYRLPPTVERVEDVEYAPGLHLDLYIGPRQPGRRPVLIHVHGGSWRGGNRRQQARPLLHSLAERGWLTASVSYPLVPEAGIDDQLTALKRAVAWMRHEGHGYGADPGFVSVTGGSAGAHLAALLATTANRPRYQKGFEDVDTSVQAAVTFYGISDLLNRNRTRDDWPIVGALMRAPPGEAEARYRDASPLDQAGPDAPPFLVVHGTHDSIISEREAASFVEALRARSPSPVAYVAVPGANHSFDLVYSVRNHHMVDGVERFLEAVRTKAPGAVST